MANRFYPTPATVKYYINDIELDDMYRVDFQRSINYQPIYGYNSMQYDFVAKGKELVNGNLIINYRYPGYLAMAILNALLASNSTKDAMSTIDDRKNLKFKDNKFKTEQLINYLDKANISTNDKLKTIANSIKESLDFDKALTNENIANILQDKYIKKLPKDSGSLANQLKSTQDKKSVLSSILDYQRVIKFDLTVRYGFQDVESYVRIFKDCVITGEGETVSAAAGGGNDISSSAQPILEIYPFFAKTIITSYDYKQKSEKDLYEFYFGNE
jgi:hypothetical protein